MRRLTVAALLALLMIAGCLLAAVARQGAQAVDLGRLLGNPEFFPALEGFLAGEVAKRVAPADAWEVKLAREGNDLAAGKLKRIEVRGTNIKTPDGLVIPSASLLLEDLVINLKPAGLKEIGNNRLTVRLDEKAVSALPSMARRKPRQLQDLRLQLTADRGGKPVLDASANVLLSGKIEGIGSFSNLPLPVEVIGVPRLNSRKPNAVDFEMTQIVAGPVRLRRELARLLETQINPIIDLSGLRAPATLTRVALEERQLVIEGKVDLTALAAPRPAVPGAGGGRRRPRREPPMP
jgi:hypothetical protein